jgi:tRNA(Ile)-lysidine synthase
VTDEVHAPYEAVTGYFATDIPRHVAVAVSGGSDSLSLLLLLKEWRAKGGPLVSAVTVDHGLRPESLHEAEWVAQLCKEWDIPHQLLFWSGRESTGNLLDQARRARHEMLAQWAKEHGITHVLLGHTRDDQAETFVMRLARGSGVDGLSAMRDRWTQNDVTFARPLLSIGRETLRDLLRSREQTWVEDPTNLDPSYERSRVREALPGLLDLGITTQGLADVATRMADARAALHHAMIQAARKIVRVEMGDVLIERTPFCELPTETARRMLLAALLWISGADYPPRSKALSAVLDAVFRGESMTLHGCDLRSQASQFRITREAAALTDVSAGIGEIWDGRWCIEGPEVAGARVKPLGQAGLEYCPDRQNSPLPARSLMAGPALWKGATLLSAPLAGLENGWTARLVPRQKHDFAAEITH